MSRRTGSTQVAIGYVGDGATSEGDFHEGANLAAVFRAPAVIFVQNNGWAISVPTAKQTAGEIWKRADGYGMPGVRVDGNDVLAVYRATRQAIARARRGEGPTLIEALTYRIGRALDGRRRRPGTAATTRSSSHGRSTPSRGSARGSSPRATPTTTS